MWIAKAFKVIGVEGFLRGTLGNWDFEPPLGLLNDVKNNLNPIDFQFCNKMQITTLCFIIPKTIQNIQRF